LEVFALQFLVVEFGEQRSPRFLLGTSLRPLVAGKPVEKIFVLEPVVA